jgi:hypothetical protein
MQSSLHIRALATPLTPYSLFSIIYDRRLKRLLQLLFQSKSHCDSQSVSQEVLVSSSIWGSWPDIYYSLTVTVWFLWGALSDERTGLSFVYAAGPCQRSLYRVRVPWESRPYFTVSDLRFPFSSPPTTRRATVEVFDPASTGVCFSKSKSPGVLLYNLWANPQRTPFPNNSSILIEAFTSPLHRNCSSSITFAYYADYV